MRLPELANKNTGCSVKLEFQTNNDYLAIFGTIKIKIICVLSKI